MEQRHRQIELLLNQPIPNTPAPPDLNAVVNDTVATKKSKASKKGKKKKKKKRKAKSRSRLGKKTKEDPAE